MEVAAQKEQENCSLPHGHLLHDDFQKTDIANGCQHLLCVNQSRILVHVLIDTLYPFICFQKCIFH